MTITRLLLVVVFFSRCGTSNNPFIQLEVVPKFDISGKIKLKISMLSNRDSLFLWDWDALSIETPNIEKNNLITSGDELQNILRRINPSQVVIENKKSERRFFTDIKFFEGETFDDKSFYKIGTSYDTIKTLPDISVFIESGYIDVNRFKIIESDTTIRLHYLFKPTKEQELSGFKPLIITSQWFSLKKG